jgi:hypothetical protein
MATPTSGDQAAKQNGTAKTGGRKRHVASAAGAARYHKPIGSEIGGPRDANHAAIQQDQGARKNYGDLISGDQAAQRKALDGMSTDDLNKLADISFSFKSADPKVVALRIAARNAQARRGIHVKVGQTQTNPTKGKPGPSSNRGSAKMLASSMPNSARLIELSIVEDKTGRVPGATSKLGNFPIPDVAHLRKAISAIGRAKPEHRPVIARHIIARAQKLNATHLVSDHIKHYARGGRQPGTVGMARGGSGAIELAGRWKHGYIPLDSVAVAEKMKGRTGGKKWWGDGTQGGVSGNLKPHGSPKSGTPKTERFGGPVKNPHKLSDEQKARGRKEANARLEARGQAPRPEPKGSTKLTKMVKSGSPKTEPRGAKPVDKMAELHAATLNKKSESSPVDRVAKLHRDTAPNGSTHKKGDLVHAKVPDKLSPVAAAVEGHSDGGKIRVSYYDSSGKKTVDVHPSKVTPRKSQTATVSKASFPPAQNRHSEPDKPAEYKTAADVHQAVLAKKITPQQGSALLEKIGRAKAPKSRTIPDKPTVDHARTNALRINAEHDAAVAKAKREGKPAPSFPYEKTAALQAKTTPKQKELLKAGAAHPNGEVRVMNHLQGESLAKQGLTKKVGAKIFITDKGRAHIAGHTSSKPVGSTSDKATTDPSTLAKNYVQMHGAAGARKKIAQLEARQTLTAKDRASLAALKAAVSGGGPGKA